MIDPQAVDELNLGPKSTADLHAALNRFDMKWQRKATGSRTDRISRF